LVSQGKPDEALAEARLTQELDPLSRIIKAHHRRILYLAGRFEQSAEQLRQVLAQDPGFFAARRYLGLTYAELGRHTEAIMELKQALALSEDSALIKAELGYAYAAAGQRDEARKIANELQAVSGESALSFQIAAIHAGLGDKDAAFEMLQKAYDERSDRMPYLKVEPRFRQLRADPGFTKLLARLGLE
jgi:tetratricopeptide (TPR) repeat protein